MIHSLFPAIPIRRGILVPRSAVAASAEPYALVGAVVRWLNAMRDEGCYTAAEVHAAAPQAYNADYYYAQVCNGGHAQFRHSSRLDPVTVRHAIGGLRAAGLPDVAACLEALRDLDPETADGALEALDARFFAAYEGYHAAMNAWLRPIVRVVPDDAFPERMRRLVARDARRERRFVDRGTLRLEGLGANPLPLALSHLAFGAGFDFVRVRPGSFVPCMGSTAIAWGVEVAGPDGPRRLCGLRVDLADLTILLPEPPGGPIRDVAALAGLIRQGRAMFDRDVDALADRAREARIGRVAGFLRHAAGLGTASVAAILPLPGAGADLPEGVALWLLLDPETGRQTIATGPGGATLSAADGTRLAKLDARALARAHRALDRRLGGAAA